MMTNPRPAPPLKTTAGSMWARHMPMSVHVLKSIPKEDGRRRPQWRIVVPMIILSLVSVVDDDESIRESLPDLLKELGFAVQVFSSAEAFLASAHLGQTRCLIVDV